MSEKTPMPADLEQEVRGWVAAVISAQRFGQDFGYALTWGPAQTPGGLMISWTILVTLRSPLLGQPPIGHVVQLVSPSALTEAAVTQAVSGAITALRAAHEQAKRPPAAPPGGPVPALANGHRR